MRSLAFDRSGSEVRWSGIPGALPAQVFLHGLGGTGAGTFGHIARHPALGAHRSLVIDLPGHGLSDRPAEWEYRLESFAEVVAGVLANEKLGHVDLVGHSMGGSIAIVLAARYPRLVRRLVVAEANLDPLPPSPIGLGSQLISAQTEDDFVSSGYAALLATAPKTWLPMLRLSDPRAVHRSAVGIVTGTRPTMRELLMNLGIPRTFIRGERGEALVGQAELEEGGVRIVTLPDVGHFMTIDAPEAFVLELGAAFG